MSPIDDLLAAKSERVRTGDEGFVPLEAEEERALSRRVRRGDLEAAWTLVLANQNFVRTVARRYQRDGLPTEDLVAEGLMGLMDAATRFDPDRGIKFITYGIWWVKRSILRHLRRAEHAVHVPKYKQYEMQEFWRTHARLASELGRPPRLDELAEVTGASPKQIHEYFALSSTDESLDDDASRSRAELRGAARDPEEEVLVRDGTVRVRDALHVLSERELHVVRHRFGLDGAPHRTLSALGRDIGLTKERVRQIEMEARSKLRREVERVKTASAPVPPASAAPAPELAEAA